MPDDIQDPNGSTRPSEESINALLDDRPIVPGVQNALLPRASSQVNAIPDPGSLVSQFKKAGADILSPQESDYMSRNVQGNVPIDKRDEVPFWAYLAAESNRLEGEKEQYLQKIFGQKSVRRDTEGNLLVRIEDKANPGKFKDVPLNAKGMSVNDLADLAINAPEMVNFMLATTLGGKGVKGFLNATRKLAQGALAGEVTGAMKDIGARAGQAMSLRAPPAQESEQPTGEGDITIGNDTDHPLLTIGKSRAVGAGIDMVAGGALGITGKALTKAASPFAGNVEEAVTQEFKEGGKLLSQHYGVDMVATPAEVSGSQLLSRIEAFASKLPGGSTVFDAMMKQRAVVLKQIQNIMSGLSKEPTEAELAARPTSSDIGEDAFGEIRKKMAPKQQAVADAESQVEIAKQRDKATGLKAVATEEERRSSLAEQAKKRAQQEGTSKIKSITGQEVVKSSQDVVDREAIGQSILDKAESLRGEFKATANEKYEKVFTHPLAKEKNIPADSIADWADKTIAEMPKKNVVSEKVGYDQYGGPIAVQTEKSETLQEFVPTGVLGKLRQLSSLKGQKLSLSELKDMRTEVNNSIAEGEALPGVKTHYLRGIASTLTDEINNLDKHIKDPSLKKLFDDATKYYRENAPQFQQADIANLFKEESQVARPGPIKVVEDVLSSPDKWKAYRTFFGANSPEMEGLKNAARNDLVRRSFDDLSGTINAKEFLGRLKTLVDNRPEVAKEIYGNTIFGLKQIAASMENVPGPAKLSSDEVERLMKTGNLTGMALNRLQVAQRELDRQYRSKLVRQIAGNKINADTFNPSEFVDRFAKTADPKEITQVMGLLHDRPDLLQRIKHRTLEGIFNDASVPNKYSSVGDAITGKGGMLNSDKIVEVLGNDVQRQRYKSIIGEDAFNDVVALAKYLKPESIKQSTFAAAGGLSAGFIINSLLKADVKYLDSFVRNFIMASIYTAPFVRKYASNTLMTPARQAMWVRGFIASTPFAEDLAENLGPNWMNKSQYIEKNVRGLINQLSREDQRSKRPPSSQQIQDVLK